MDPITGTVWLPAHLAAGSWHWADLLSGLLVFVAVAALVLVVASRRARLGGADRGIDPCQRSAVTERPGHHGE